MAPWTLIEKKYGPDVLARLPPSGLSFPLSLFFDPAQNHALDQFWGNADAANGQGCRTTTQR
jgi:hypothetical protein